VYAFKEITWSGMSANPDYYMQSQPANNNPQSLIPNPRSLLRIILKYAKIGHGGTNGGYRGGRVGCPLSFT